MDRRAFVAAGAGLVAAASLPAAQHIATRTRLILLGTGGGPRPRVERTAASQVIIANGAAYVVDCGDGVARQLAAANVPFPTLRHIFITHHHSDHNADYGNLILLASEAGLNTRLDTWGPPPLDRITTLFFEMSATNIETRIRDEGRAPLRPLVHVHEITRAGDVLQDDNVKVTCAVVPHPMIEHALAYRFDAHDRSIVISGDTAFSEDLIRLAHGADVLVHEAMYLPAVDRLVARVPTARRLKEHLLASHTSAEDAGRVAQEAGVKLLVLSHFVPADDPAITDEMWIDAARTRFPGPIIVGRDLLEI